MRNGLEIQLEILNVESQIAQKAIELKKLQTRKAELEKEVIDLRNATFVAEVKQKQKQIEAQAQTETEQK